MHDKVETEGVDDDTDPKDDNTQLPTGKRPRAKKDDQRFVFDKTPCLTTSHDDVVFRKQTAFETYIFFFRQTRPDIKLWKWDAGIWLTNNRLANNTLFGECCYRQADLTRAKDNSVADLFMKSSVNIY